jgi:molecular chaperone HscA
MPLLKKLLSEFGVDIFDSIDPDKAVALGAALQAENLTSSSKDLIIDVVPLSLGMELMGGMVEKIILKNTPIPISVTKEFTTYADNQTEVQINILQGEREMVQNCRILGRFAISNIPPMKAGNARIAVTFHMDADGLLTVSATEKITGIHQTIEIKPNYGINIEYVEEMLEDSYIHAKEDHEQRLITETIIDANSDIASIKSALSETPELINVEEKKKIEEKITELEEFVRAKNRDNILRALEELHTTSEDFTHKRMDFILKKTLEGKSVKDIH